MRYTFFFVSIKRNTPCKMINKKAKIFIALDMISRALEICLKEETSFILLKYFNVYTSSKTAWAMPGIELPCLLDVGDMSAPVATNRTFFSLPFSILFMI